jgi:hypothetical protein
VELSAMMSKLVIYDTPGSVSLFISCSLSMYAMCVCVCVLIFS